MSRNVLVRSSQLALLGLLIAVTAGATDSSARFDKDSHEMMCGCSCNQLLGECNHVGCPDSRGCSRNWRPLLPEVIATTLSSTSSRSNTDPW